MPAEKIIVGLSGGVDSSVTTLLLKEQGYQVEALFMKNWREETEDGGCMWEADVEDAIQVCDQLDIPLNTVDLSADYRERVFSGFLQDYKNGKTPNPDVLCNQEIKFKAFLEHAESLGAEKIATGHYTRIENRDEDFQLVKGRDTNKDQSYFLCRLDQAQLAKTLFPVGEMEKSEVRERAQRAGLVTHNKKDSTGICFIGKRPFRQFLQKYIPSDPGDIINTSGRVIGQHDGIVYYTLGQRQGLGIGGVSGAAEAPWYVVQKRYSENILVVAQDHDHPLLQSTQCRASAVHWISGSPPDVRFRCKAKIRYRQPDQECTVQQLDRDCCEVHFLQAQRAVTPGQFIVFYQDSVCLGGGIIDSTK